MPKHNTRGSNGRFVKTPPNKTAPRWHIQIELPLVVADLVAAATKNPEIRKAYVPVPKQNSLNERLKRSPLFWTAYTLVFLGIIGYTYLRLTS